MENNGPDHIAIKRIGEVRRVGWTELGLGNLELIELPKEICDLVVLRRLYLSPNKLTSLPSGIGNLINLNELVVRDNKLASLPREIGQLTNLWSLEIRENQLTELPSEIGKLENLEKLDVSCNKLLSIPSEIGKLKNLKRLIANNLAWEGSSEGRNNLTFLPPEIRQLEKLEELDLRGNPLPIPPEILEKYDEPQTILNYYFSIFKINVSDAININTIEMEVVGLHVGKRLNETKLGWVRPGW
jgi:Leucine-rich repeat (LRR) protein